MFIEAPKVTADQMNQIAENIARMNANTKAREESFVRCDTDGFVSQFGYQLDNEKIAVENEILENGGCAEFPVLVYDGKVVATKIYEFKNENSPYANAINRMWRLPDELAEVMGRKWVPVGKKSRIQKKLGLTEETRWFPAEAYIAGNGRGFSGMASAWVGVRKVR